MTRLASFAGRLAGEAGGAPWLLGAALLLSACGGGGEEDSAAPFGARLAVKVPAARVVVLAEPAGANCAAGGTRVGAGIDANGDGLLSAAETASVQYVCNGSAGGSGATGSAGGTGAPGAAGVPGSAGAAGAPGATGLVRVTVEAAGPRCVSGGSRIDVGADRDGNAVLDPSEVTSTGYVCDGAAGAVGSSGSNGTNGTNGTNGADGISSLIAIAAEPAGANCAYGGSRVSSGLDGNGDRVLQPAEVATTTYLCHPPPAGLAWTHVTTAAVQALPNTGYLADSALAVTVTLPAQPATGDVVRVSGIGSGGWTIAQNAGQQIVFGLTPWAARDVVRAWRGVAASADGRQVVACDYAGRLLRSIDSGLTWTQIGAVRNWRSVASSADGTRLVAGVENGDVYTSADSGATWAPSGLSGTWYGLASSADGSRIVAAQFSNGYLHTSSDFGATWTARDSPRSWVSVASSADGNKLVAADYNSGFLYTSTDSGVTWTPRADPRIWRSVASSADGTRLVATEFPGRLWVSADSGLSWTPREAVRSWHYVASSADGRRLVASVYGERVYRSVDHGVTWTPLSTTSANWWGVATSADGSVVVAAPDNDRIHNAGAPLLTTAGATGGVSGSRYESIELLYAGGGIFSTLTSLGALVLH